MTTDAALQEDARRALLRFMEDLSEAHWAAGWVGDLEHLLWDDMAMRQSCGLSHYEASQLRWLAGLAGGWWIWKDADEKREFVVLAEWMLLHAIWIVRKESE